jgi:hypothetical protein
VLVKNKEDQMTFLTYHSSEPPSRLHHFFLSCLAKIHPKVLIRLFIAWFILSTTISNAQIVVNEICPANGDIKYDPIFYNFSSWIELYNPGASSVNVGGYYLSDDASQPLKWRIPAGISIAGKGFLLIWCDAKNTGIHTNFDLDAEGEDVVLTAPGLSVVDKITYPRQFTNVSYGRTTDGSGAIGYLIKPTPGTANDASTGTVRLENPSISLKSGRYTGSQSVSLAHSTPDVAIRYTINGSEPTETSSLYNGPLTLSSTTTLKAKAFKSGMLPSKSEVKTFFIGEHQFALPVVSISMDPKYLSDNTIGIYADGTNGIPGPCTSSPFNWNQDWSRHATVEFFDNVGKKFFDQSVDLRIAGNCTRQMPSKSFAIRARDKYGSNTIEEKLFASKESASYGSVVLRNSGNDFWNTMFRDALMQSIVKDQMDIDYLAYDPKAIYLNGQYWGILNLREKIDADYFESNYGIDKSDLDLIEWGALEGSVDGYQNYLTTLASIDRSTEQAFQLIDNNIDVQEFINYQVSQIYFCNTDWPGNNVKFWRQRSTNGKWRWVLWDMDFGMGLYQNVSYPTHPTLDFATADDGPAWPNPPWSTAHLRMLLENPQFKSRFIETFTAALSTTFKPERVVEQINSFQQKIAPEMVYHTARWGIAYSNWNNEVQRLRDFATERSAFMDTYFGNFFGLTDKVRFSIQVPSGKGKFVMNGITSDESITDAPYFRGVSYTVEAEPIAGYMFNHWEITERESTALPLIALGSTWKYFDDGVEPATDWETQAFSDLSWEEAPAQLGYGDGDEASVISYGSDPGNKYITTYFRKEITIADTTGFSILSGKVLFDDGVVIYLNGEEVYRGNLTAGTITNSTLALTAGNENIYEDFVVAKGKIKPGANVIAVEVHQNSSSSSDISFDLQLSTVILGNVVTTTTSAATVSGSANTDVVMEAFFDSVEPINGIVINEFSAASVGYEDEKGEQEDWIEIYNNGDEAIDLSKLYFTDDLTNKTKYQLRPTGEAVTIQPGEYKILVADEELFDGPLHLNFKLSSEGETIAIFQKVGDEVLSVDQVTYGQQWSAWSYRSFSRIPNVTGPFIWTSVSTPSAVNIYEEVVATEDYAEAKISVFPNPSTDYVDIESPAEITAVKITSVAGEEIQNARPFTNEVRLSVSDLDAGIYLLYITTRQKTVVTKIIKRR